MLASGPAAGTRTHTPNLELAEGAVLWQGEYVPARFYRPSARARELRGTAKRPDRLRRSRVIVDRLFVVFAIARHSRRGTRMRPSRRLLRHDRGRGRAHVTSENMQDAKYWPAYTTKTRLDPALVVAARGRSAAWRDAASAARAGSPTVYAPRRGVAGEGRCPGCW